MKVLSVTAEVYPLVKTGGLADVAGALPAALTGEKVEVRTLIPGYPAVMEALEGAEAVLTYPDLMGGPARVLAGRGGGLDLFVLEAAHLYDRSGNPYLNASGEDWPDNGLRFAALARAAADIGQGKLRGYRPNLIHGHDWQAALTPAYLRYDGLKAPPFILTIHNLAFQGRFPRAQLAAMGLPDEAFAIHGVEYYGDIGMLKAGILMADRVTTVSPTYAAEIASEAGGMGLGGLLQARGDALVGILNGLDTKVWDPLSDPLIARPFSPAKLAARGQQGGPAGTVRAGNPPGRSAVRRCQPSDGAEGAGPAAGGAADAAGDGRPAGSGRLGGCATGSGIRRHLGRRAHADRLHHRL